MTAAILLAGGRASRLGGRDKPRLVVGGRTLLEHALAAVSGCAPVTVVGDPVGVGGVVTDVGGGAAAGVDGGVADVGGVVAGVGGVLWVREDPPFGGPAAAVVAALGLADAGAGGADAGGVAGAVADGADAGGVAGAVEVAAPEWTVLLACDLPRAEAAVARLLRDLPLLPADTDGVCLADPSSRPQWLTGVYRTAALRRAAAALPDAGAGASMRDLLDDLAIAVVSAPADETADIDTWEDLQEARARYGGPDEESS